MIMQLSRDDNESVSAARNFLNQKASSVKYYPGTRALYADTWSEAQYNVARATRNKVKSQFSSIVRRRWRNETSLTVSEKTARIV